MRVKLLAFGIAKDILGARELSLDLPDQSRVRTLKDFLSQKHPDFCKLRSLALAVNQEYASDDQIIRAGDEVVIIPPVSGG